MVTKYTKSGLPYGGPPYTAEEEAAMYASWSGPTHAISRSQVVAAPGAEPSTPRVRSKPPQKSTEG